MNLLSELLRPITEETKMFKAQAVALEAIWIAGEAYKAARAHARRMNCHVFTPAPVPDVEGEKSAAVADAAFVTLERLVEALACVFGVGSYPRLDDPYQTWVDFVREEKAENTQD